jgi:5-hydroxyisourate hydrolase-like protein (transthyretin family)
MSTLSTHVLDTMNGRPAAGMTVALTGPDGETARAQTNADGRCPDLVREALARGATPSAFPSPTISARPGSRSPIRLSLMK